MAKPKNYSSEELRNLDTDELLKVYNRTAERLNKQVTRLKNAGVYDETAALYDVERAPVYRTERAKNAALSDMEKLTQDILALQERASGKITVKQASNEIIGIKRDLVIMYKGSHIGGDQFTKEQMDELWHSIKSSDLAAIKKAKEHFGATSNSQLFYEIQRRLKVNGNDMPQFKSVSDITDYVNSAVANLPNNELPLTDQAAALAKQYTKRW